VSQQAWVRGQQEVNDIQARGQGHRGERRSELDAQLERKKAQKMAELKALNDAQRNKLSSELEGANQKAAADVQRAKMEQEANLKKIADALLAARNKKKDVGVKIQSLEKNHEQSELNADQENNKLLEQIAKKKFEKLNGSGTKKLKNIDGGDTTAVYTGDIKNGKPHGDGILEFSNGDAWKGNFFSGERDIHIREVRKSFLIHGRNDDWISLLDIQVKYPFSRVVAIREGTEQWKNVTFTDKVESDYRSRFPNLTMVRLSAPFWLHGSDCKMWSQIKDHRCYIGDVAFSLWHGEGVLQDFEKEEITYCATYRYGNKFGEVHEFLHHVTKDSHANASNGWFGYAYDILVFGESENSKAFGSPHWHPTLLSSDPKIRQCIVDFQGQDVCNRGGVFRHPKNVSKGVIELPVFLEWDMGSRFNDVTSPWFAILARGAGPFFIDADLNGWTYKSGDNFEELCDRITEMEEEGRGAEAWRPDHRRNRKDFWPYNLDWSQPEA